MSLQFILSSSKYTPKVVSLTSKIQPDRGKKDISWTRLACGTHTLIEGPPYFVVIDQSNMVYILRAKCLIIYVVLLS